MTKKAANGDQEGLVREIADNVMWHYHNSSQFHNLIGCGLNKDSPILLNGIKRIVSENNGRLSKELFEEESIDSLGKILLRALNQYNEDYIHRTKLALGEKELKKFFDHPHFIDWVVHADDVYHTSVRDRFFRCDPAAEAVAQLIEMGVFGSSPKHDSIGTGHGEFIKSIYERVSPEKRGTVTLTLRNMYPHAIEKMPEGLEYEKIDNYYHGEPHPQIVEADIRDMKDFKKGLKRPDSTNLTAPKREEWLERMNEADKKGLSHGSLLLEGGEASVVKEVEDVLADKDLEFIQKLIRREADLQDFDISGAKTGDQDRFIESLGEKNPEVKKLVEQHWWSDGSRLVDQSAVKFSVALGEGTDMKIYPVNAKKYLEEVVKLHSEMTQQLSKPPSPTEMHKAYLKKVESIVKTEAKPTVRKRVR